MRPEGDADVADVATGVCVQLLRWSLVCTAPGLSAVAAQCLLVAGHQGEQVAAEWAAADADAQCKAAEKKLVGKHVRAFESLRAGSSRADNESERAGSSRDGAHSQPEQMMAMARWLLRLAFWSKRSKSKVAAETAPVARDAVKAMEDEPVVEDLE